MREIKVGNSVIFTGEDQLCVTKGMKYRVTVADIDDGCVQLDVSPHHCGVWWVVREDVKLYNKWWKESV